MQRTAKTINKKYMEYFIPTVLTVMATNLASIVDSVIAGNLLGGKSLAAINLMTPVSQLFLAFTILFGLGASSVASVYKGKNEEQSANEVFSASVVSVLTVSVIMAILMLAASKSICGLFSGDPELNPLISAYYIPLISGMPITLLLLCSVYFIRLDARPRFATVIIVVSNVVNLLCDLLYMGVFKTGIMGASLATVTGNAVGLCLMLTHFFSRRCSFHFDFSIIKIKKLWSVLKEVLPIGFSTASGTLFVILKLFFLNMLVMKTGGSTAMVAFSVCMSAQMLISLFISGASQTMIPVIGVCLGERDYTGIRYAFRSAARILIISGVIIVAVLWILTEPIVRFFGIFEMQDVANAVRAVRLTSFSLWGMEAVYLYLYYYMAVQKKSISVMLSALHEVIILIPTALIMSRLWGVTGLWLSLPVTDAITLLILRVRILFEIWKSKEEYKDSYLLKDTETNEIASFSIKASFENAARLSEYLGSMLKVNGVEEKRANKAAIAVEEYTAAVFMNKAKQTSDIDIRVLEDSQKILLVIRDNGKEMNSLEHEEALEYSSLKMLSVISESVEYSRVIGFNRVMIRI